MLIAVFVKNIVDMFARIFWEVCIRVQLKNKDCSKLVKKSHNKLFCEFCHTTKNVNNHQENVKNLTENISKNDTGL